MFHVDDFLCAGPQANLAWMRHQLKAEYEVDGDILGWKSEEVHVGKFLGRIIRCVPGGLEWEADPKQVESLVDEFGLDHCNGADTPGVKAKQMVRRCLRWMLRSFAGELQR